MNLLFEMNSGIAGDMTIGALLDLGADKESLIKGIELLTIDGYTLFFEKEKVLGEEVFNFDVHLEKNYRGRKRYLKDVIKIIENTKLSTNIKINSINMFNILAKAEAKAHKVPIDKIDFHEVGAIDTLIDIVGTSILLDNLSPENIYFSELYDGTGFINYRFGKLPVPVPAVKNIAQKYQLKINEIDEQGEHITPTGATIVANYKDKTLPSNEYRVGKVGYGVGNRKFESGRGILKVKEIIF